jgi:hypothetical protein
LFGAAVSKWTVARALEHAFARVPTHLQESPRGATGCAQSSHRSLPSVTIHNGSYLRKPPCGILGWNCRLCQLRAWWRRDGSSGGPWRLRLCGEPASGPGDGVAISQEDRPAGSLQAIRLSLGTARCSSPAKILAAGSSPSTYEPLLEALRSFGKQVLILPWVVGVRGMVDAKSVLEILDFPSLPLSL